MWSDDFDISDDDMDYRKSRPSRSAGGVSSPNRSTATNLALAKAQKYIGGGSSATSSPARNRRRSRHNDLDMSDLGLTDDEAEVDSAPKTTQKRFGASAYASHKLEKSPSLMSSSSASQRKKKTQVGGSSYGHTSHNQESSSSSYRVGGMASSARKEEESAKASTSLAQALLEMSDESVEIDFSDDEAQEDEVLIGGDPPPPNASIPISYKSQVSGKEVNYSSSTRPSTFSSQSYNTTSYAAASRSPAEMLDDTDESIEIDYAEEEEVEVGVEVQPYGHKGSSVSTSRPSYSSSSTAATSRPVDSHSKAPVVKTTISENVYGMDDMSASEFEEEIIEEETIIEESILDQQPSSSPANVVGTEYAYDDEEFQDIGDTELQDLTVDIASPNEPSPHHTTAWSTTQHTHKSGNSHGQQQQPPTVQRGHHQSHHEVTAHRTVVHLKDTEAQTDPSGGFHSSYPANAHETPSYPIPPPHFNPYGAPVYPPYQQGHGHTAAYGPLFGTPGPVPMQHHSHSYAPPPATYPQQPPRRTLSSGDAAAFFQTQLSTILHTLDACRQVLSAARPQWSSYRYPSFEETQQMIARNRRPTLTMEEALKRVELNDY